MLSKAFTGKLTMHGVHSARTPQLNRDDDKHTLGELEGKMDMFKEMASQARVEADDSRLLTDKKSRLLMLERRKGDLLNQKVDRLTSMVARSVPAIPILSIGSPVRLIDPRVSSIQSVLDRGVPPIDGPIDGLIRPTISCYAPHICPVFLGVQA